MSRVVMPRAYIDRILASKPAMRVWPLGDDTGLERSLPITRRGDLDFAKIPLQSFLAFSVAAVAARLRLLVMLRVLSASLRSRDDGANSWEIWCGGVWGRGA